MKILFLTNLYPPFYIGGNEICCKNVAVGLRSRGHNVRVLTSTYKVNRKIIDDCVYRCLNFGFGYKPLAAYNPFYLASKINSDVKSFRTILNDFKPDIIYIWGLFGISKYLLLEACNSNLPVAFELADEGLANNIDGQADDDWFRFWSTVPQSIFLKLTKFIISILFGLHLNGLKLEREFNKKALKLINGCFVSADLMQRYENRNVLFKNSLVIYNGIQTNIFYNKKIRQDDKILLILYVGQVAEHKGVHTAISALADIKKGGYSNFVFDIVGDGLYEYKERLVKEINDFGITEYVRFMGKKTIDELPDIYNSHHIFIFPSIWKEPFGLTILEAMSTGMAVVGTATGGNKEFMADENNYLVFAPNDHNQLARQLKRLINDNKLRNDIAKNAEETAKTFDVNMMVDKKEGFLNKIVLDWQAIK